MPECAVDCLLGDRPWEELGALTSSDIEIITQELSNSGLCSYALSRITEFSTSLPDEFIARLRRMAATEYMTWLQGEAAIHPVIEIIARFAGEAVVIKGRAVAAAVYATPHLRHSADIDVVVTSKALPALFEQLQSAGFDIDRTNSARFRNGPLVSIQDVLLQPHDEFISCDELPLSTREGLNLDLKLDPLESGLCMKELGRFFADSRKTRIAGVEVSTPDLVDQLLIACCHFHKDGFSGLRLLLDIHLLSRVLSNEDWHELWRRAEVEGVERSVVTALRIAVDRLGSVVPERSRLTPAGTCSSPKSGLSPAATMVSYRFLWNQNSLPMMVLNALTSCNRQRKLRALWGAFFPRRSFLTAYYAGGQDVGFAAVAMLWCLHAFTIFAPAGVVRRTLGRILWKP